MGTWAHKAGTEGDTHPASRGRKSTHTTSRDRWGHVPNRAEAGGDPYLTGRGAQGIHPTGRDRRGRELNRQRQMGTQQAETDGGWHPTGGDRWGHVLNRQRQKGTQPNRHPTCDMYPTGEDKHSSGGDRDGDPVREAGGPQKEKASQRGPRRPTDMQARHRESQLWDSRAELRVLADLPGGQWGKVRGHHPTSGAALPALWQTPL